TGTFSAAGSAPTGSTGDGASAVGVSAVGVSVAGDAAASGSAGGATCGQGSGAAGGRGGTWLASAGLLAGDGLTWEPLCQVRARITWVVSSAFPVRPEPLVSRSSNCRAVGRLCGSLVREASTSGSTESGTEAMSASPYMIRYR